ncbi:hypothetical protein HAZT_HAZT011572 [Hyalella azteca]|uniref:SAM-dependent MTase RsmB/NOP-type domain-containing protein n=1 Tax=Hyalella azteca TaxID=294128 RepID=A0A6A0H297_HYAAZ|nr:hypothetical protein HAZT_HAZT011572 [Hyalella azteca]
MAIEAADVLTPVGGTGKLAHSIKVPQFYKFSSKVLLNYLQFKGRIPKLIQQQTRGERECWIKQVRSFLLALVAELDIVRAALNNVGVLEKNPYLRVETALVIAGDMLLSLSRSQRLTSQCKPVLTMLEVEKELQDEYQKLLQNAPVKLGLVVPRWVCINTLLISTQKARQHLSDEGFTLKSYSPKTYEKFLQSIQDLGKWDYMEDFHFAEVLVFSASTAVMSSTLVSSGKLLLQDKVILYDIQLPMLQPGDVVLDACAAPGNKSTVLAGLMANQGKLICIERDPERFTVLKKRVKHHGVRNVLFINEDFTSVDPSELQGVTTILLDPSCSNSGLEMNTDSASVSGERYRRLADMQFQLLSFALSLPSVQSVVYSTCSVQSIENEEVVARALQQFTNFELDDLSLKLKDWRSFGDENYSFAKKVLRTQTFYDLCHGFFVAKFVARRVFLNGKTESETAEPKEENSKKKPKTVLGAKAENSKK